MTKLAQALASMFHECGITGVQDAWLEAKAKEIEELVRIPKYKVGDTIEWTDDFGDKHLMMVDRIEDDGKVVRYYNQKGRWIADFPTGLVKSVDDAKVENRMEEQQ